MHTSLKNVTERAQKYDFSVNFHILIAYNKSMDPTPLNIALKKAFQL